MNSYQRDAVKSTIPSFKTASYTGKPDPNLYTDELALGRHLSDTHKSFSLPSFDDLLRGLQHLPTGLDARGLTQCLAWYLHCRDSFTPRLDLNVLHTQALIRALRQPLKPFGPQNLDRNALQEWRDKAGFDSTKLPTSPTPKKQSVKQTEAQQKTQLHMNLDNDSVQLNLTLPLRHIFTFPFIAVQGLVGEALKLGLEKAERRQSAREAQDERRAVEAKWAARLASNADVVDKGAELALGQHQHQQQQHEDANEKNLYRIPKRARPAEQDSQLASSSSSKKKPKPAPTLISAYSRRDMQSRPAYRHQGPAYRDVTAYPQPPPCPPPSSRPISTAEQERRA